LCTQSGHAALYSVYQGPVDVHTLLLVVVVCQTAWSVPSAKTSITPVDDVAAGDEPVARTPPRDVQPLVIVFT
jgi:hypothetical protein